MHKSCYFSFISILTFVFDASHCFLFSFFPVYSCWYILSTVAWPVCTSIRTCVLVCVFYLHTSTSSCVSFTLTTMYFVIWTWILFLAFVSLCVCVHPHTYTDPFMYERVLLNETCSYLPLLNWFKQQQQQKPERYGEKAFTNRRKPNIFLCYTQITISWAVFTLTHKPLYGSIVCVNFCFHRFFRFYHYPYPPPRG